MNANQFRRSNIVIHRGQPHFVDTICKDELGLVAIGGTWAKPVSFYTMGNNNKFVEGDIHGMPLTMDNCKQFGIKTHKDGMSIKIGSVDYSIISIQEQDYKAAMDGTKDQAVVPQNAFAIEVAPFNYINIPFVHDLQNAYYLLSSGSELPIKF